MPCAICASPIECWASTAIPWSPPVARATFALPTLDTQALPGPESIQRWELANEIKFLARENFASPSVVISGILPVGSLLDEEGKAGCAYLTGMGLMRGTAQRTSQAIFESVESIGARLSFSAGVHSTTFMGKGLVDDLDLLLELLTEVLRSASFPKVEIERLKAQQLTGLAIRAQDTSAQAQMAFDELVYRDHPYRIPSDGFVESVQSITAADLRRFHRKHYRPQGMILSVVGGVRTEKALAAVERTLGQWQVAGKAQIAELPDLKPLKREKRRSVHIVGKQQSDLIVGVAGPSRYDPDYLAAAQGNHILGRFGMMGRIGESVREAAGLAYYAYSAVSGGPGPGPWQVIAGINPANEERALEIIRSEIKRFVSTLVTREELIENQAHLIGRLPLQLESNEGVAGALTHMERYGLGLDYYQRYPVLVAGVTRDQILHTAQRFLDPDRLAIAIAGPRKV
ncbi:MAG: insulinase family protein [Anaerolineales bacterium]|nr:MAG: insulinase family protein [Anaerolineales bacterium]